MQNAAGAVRYALRQFWAARVFTVAAVLTLALGIGGTTAIFTLIHAVMLRSLPVVDPESLYRLGDSDTCCVQGGPQDNWGMYSFALFERLKAATPEFEEVTAFQAAGARLSVRRQGVDPSPRPLRSEYVTGNYFRTLGVGAFGGRVFTDDDDKPSATPVAVLSHHVWQRLYGSDTSVVGSTFTVEGQPFTIVGIAPPGFFGETLRANPPEIWLPLQQEPLITNNNGLLRQPVSAWLRVIGRLRPGASTDGMSARLTALLRDWMVHDSGYPSNWMPEVQRTLANQTINVVPAGGGVGTMKSSYRSSLQILLGVCGLVLLIACANVANLLLARAVGRRSQTAVRLAIGASRRQIIGQALLESVLLALAGGVAGLFVSVAAAQLLLRLAFAGATFVPVSTTPSPLVLGFAFTVALITGIAFGAAPAWLATRTDPVDALRGSGRGGSGRFTTAQKVLLVVQATLSVVLVAGATMLGRSLARLEDQDLGYQVPGRAVIALKNPPASYTRAQLQAVYRRLEERLEQLPGVQGAGLALYNPLVDNWGELVLVEGHPPPAPGENAGSSWDRVSASYLQDFGMTILRGRGITDADTATSESIAVVNEAFVKRFFKNGEDPLGRRFGLDLPENVGTYRIVGVVRDAKFASFTMRQPARPMFFVALAQHVEYANPMMARLELASHNMGGAVLVTSMSAAALEPLVTKAVAEVDPNLTIISVRTMQQQVELTFNQERAVASLAGLFGIVALLLAAIGLYGVTAYMVAQRTNEIGIRMALGADRRNVLGLILRLAFRRVALGLLLGVPLAIGAGRLISTQLYGVRFWDPVALGSAAGALALAALIAALIPAARAAGISPMHALRLE